MRQNGWAVGLILFTAVGVAAAAGGGAASFPGANGLIAFASDRDPLLNRPQIFEARVSGGRPAGLSGSEAGDYDPTPAPNGRLIAFVRVDRIRNEAAIWVMNADGSRQRRLAPGEHPVWSRDSKTIAYSFFNDELCGPGIYRCGFAIELRAVRVDESELGTIASAARHPTWSRNGLRIAYEGGIDPYGDAHEIDVANADGTNRHPIAADGAGSPAWSPTGRRIAYSLAKRIYVVRPDGTGRRRLADGEVPIWSYDGGRLAYLHGLSRDSQTFALWVVDADGRHRRLVARAALLAAWSPRARRLAYVRPDGVFVVSPNGRGRGRVISKENSLAIRSLAWSADGRRLLFTEVRDTNDLEIYTTSVDGSRVRQLTDNAVDDRQPSWSADGTRLAFVRARAAGVLDIWLTNASGTEQRRVAQNGFDPSWTPDGNRIVFSRYTGTAGIYSTYSVSVAGGDERLLVADGLHSSPSPDGTRLAFLRASAWPEHLFVAAADGGAETPLIVATATGSLSWSPDSASLAFEGDVTAGQAEAVYTIRVDGTGLTPVVDHAHSPSFSPEGTALAFTAAGPQGSQIETSTLDGSARRVISSAPGRNVDPDWQSLPR